MVRRAAHRRDRRRAPGDHRPPAGRPVLRDLPQPRPPAPPRRVGELAGLARLDGGAALRDGAAGRHHPGHGHAAGSRPTSRTGSRSPTRRCGRRSQPATRRRGRGSRRAGRSCATRWASTSTPTCCRSRTSRPWLPPFLLRPDRAMTLAEAEPAPPGVVPCCAFAGSRPALLSSAGRRTRNTVTPSFVSEDRVPLAREKKQEVITQYAVKDGDTGSPEVQVALLTERIRDLDGAPPPLPQGQPFAPRPPQARGSAPAPSRVPGEEGRHSLSSRDRLARTPPLGLAAADPGR